MSSITDTTRFLQAIFPDFETDAIFANLNPPAHTRDVTGLDLTRDCYWSIAAFPNDGAATRTLARAIAVRALVADDVGSKLPASAVRRALGEPTAMVETSAGNFQWTYRLATPVPVAAWGGFFAAVERLVGLTLEGRDAVHLFRLPCGVNSKPGREGFAVRLTQLNPGIELSGIMPAAEVAAGPSASLGPEPRVRGIGKITALIPNNDVSYDAWITRAHQIKALSLDPEAGWQAFNAWSRKSTKHDPDETARRWATVAPSRTFGLELLKEAEAIAPEAFTAIMNAEARAVFDDGEGLRTAGDGAEAYAPTHANMRDAVLRQERGWLGWLSNAPQRWAAFDGALGRWSIGETDAAMRTAVRKAIAARKKLALEPKAAKEMSKAAWTLAVHTLLRNHSLLEIPRAQFNADPDLLGVPGGCLRFGAQTQEEAGRADHMLSKATRFKPGPRRGGSGCARWDKFMLEFASGDRSLVRWLQAYAGYCLTGHIGEHVMVFIYGPGGNGKSVFIDTLGAVMGDYHVRADHRLFMAKQGGMHLAPLAALEGARLVTSPDVPPGVGWDLGMIKQVTGGGSVTANHMRENPFSFFPQCKLILAGNDKPSMASVDEGIRRRFRLVQATHIPAVIDRSLPDKLMLEGEGILRWMITGLEFYQQFGLPACPRIEEATDAYLSGADVFGRWFDSNLTAAPASYEKVRVGELWRSWDAFRAAEGAFHCAPKDLGGLSTRLQEKGERENFRHGRDKKGGFFTGITLRNAAADVF